jgi:ATP-dependent Clp protease ATP-binding subunit ClpA
MPVSHSLKHVLALVAEAHQNDTETIEPLHLLAAILGDHTSRAAQLLRDQRITPQKVANALDSGPDR